MNVGGRALVVGLLAAAPAWADASSPPLRLHLSEYASSAWHLDNGNIAPPTDVINYDPTGSNYGDWINRLQADASWRELTAQLRLDSALFANVPVAAPGDARMEGLLQHRYGDRADLEKASLGYTTPHLEVTLGDSYVTFGRGLVLALRKVDELGIDTTARGLSATARAAGFTLQGLAGLSNIVNVDPASGRTAADPDDRIFGGRAQYRLGRWLVPGADVARIDAADGSDHVTAFSATLEAPHLGDYGTFYVEYARQLRSSDPPEVAGRRSALYASGSAYLGRATLTVEYKDYRQFEPVATSLSQLDYPELALTDFYNAPPTLERVQQPVLDNQDVAGPHARLSVRVNDHVVPYLSMAVFEDRTYHTHIYDPYAGTELRWDEGRSRASLSSGFRLDRYDANGPFAGLPLETDLHVEYDVNQHLAGPYSVELDGLHMTRGERQGQLLAHWLEGQAYLSFKKADAWAVALGYEYYTATPATTRSSYVNANLMWQARSDLLLRLFVGGQRGGIKCVNGVCRDYPAFDGARLEVVAKY